MTPAQEKFAGLFSVDKGRVARDALLGAGLGGVAGHLGEGAVRDVRKMRLSSEIRGKMDAVKGDAVYPLTGEKLVEHNKAFAAYEQELGNIDSAVLRKPGVGGFGGAALGGGVGAATALKKEKDRVLRNKILAGGLGTAGIMGAVAAGKKE